MSKPEKNHDVISNLLSQIREAENLKDASTAYLQFLKAATHQFKSTKAHITSILIGLASLVFLFQSAAFIYMTQSFPHGVLYVLTQIGSLRGLTAFLFVEFPWVAWPLTEFLHKGIGHFLANIALLALFGKILEPKFRTRHYVLWFILVMLIVKPTDAIIALSTSSKSLVAAYGISDFVFSLGFYTAVSLINADNRNELEALGFLIGGAAVLHVGYQVVRGALVISVQPINFAHLMGGILGLAIFGFVRFRAP